MPSSTRWRAAHELLDQPPRDRGSKQGITGGDRTDVLGQLLRTTILHKKAAGPRTSSPRRRTRSCRRLSASARGEGSFRRRRGGGVASRPSSSGMRMSISTTSGSSLSRQGDGFPGRRPPRPRPPCRPGRRCRPRSEVDEPRELPVRFEPCLVAPVAVGARRHDVGIPRDGRNLRAPQMRPARSGRRR